MKTTQYMKHTLFSKYLKAVAWLCFFCLSTVVIINLTIDPGKVYVFKPEHSQLKFVTQLVRSKHGLSKYLNLRDVKRTLGLYPSTAECTIIGSSRILQVSSVRQEKSLTNTCSSILNLAVDGASLEDYLALSDTEATTGSDSSTSVIDLAAAGGAWKPGLEA